MEEKSKVHVSPGLLKILRENAEKKPENEYKIELRNGRLSLTIRIGTTIRGLGVFAEQYDAMKFLSDCMEKYPDSVGAVEKYKSEYGIDLYDSKGRACNIKTPAQDKVEIVFDGKTRKYENKSSADELNRGEYIYKCEWGTVSTNKMKRNIYDICNEKIPTMEHDSDSFLIVHYVNSCAQNNLSKITEKSQREKIKSMNDSLIAQSSKNLELKNKEMESI